MTDKTTEKTPGEILREIREKLNISIDDLIEDQHLSKDYLGRDWVELLESGKTPFTTDKAEIVCRRINSILEKRNVDIIVDPEDFFNPGRYDAKESVEEYITEWNKHKDDKDYIIDKGDIDVIDLFLNQYNLMDKKIKAYEIIGDIYCKNRDYEKEYEYMLKAWEATAKYPKRKLNYRIVTKLGNNYVDRGKYQEAVSVYQNALMNTDNIPEKYLAHIYYNYAIAYYELKMYPLALELIADTLRYSENKNYDLWKLAYVLQGLCYLEMGENESALNSYTKALQVQAFTRHSDFKYLIYGNIAETYIKLKDINNANKCLDIILQDLDKLDKDGEFYSKICHEVAFIYKNLGELEQAEKYYKESLEYAEKNVEHGYIPRNIKSLFRLDDEKKIEDLSAIMEGHEERFIYELEPNDHLFLLLKQLERYSNNKEFDKFKKLLAVLIKYIGGEGI
jgi:tetratricopeptide (TPR) repeat protein